MDAILRSLLNNCLELLAQNNKPTLRNNICDILDLLDNGLYETSSTDDDDDDDDDDDAESVCSDDMPFTDVELSYIKNDAHYEYLVRYSLIPTYPHQYYKSFMDGCA
jgi:hypothetical protein